MISPLRRAFLLKSTFIKRNGLATVRITPSRSLDTLSTKYNNIVLAGDFNACLDDEALQNFRKCYSLHSLTKQSTSLKNPENPSCIDLILTNKPCWFQTKCVIETGLSDFHRMRISVFKIHFRKVPSKVIDYRDFRKMDNEKFINSIHYTLSQELTDCRKNPDKYFEISQNILKKRHPEERSIFVETINLLWLNRIQKP